jgi:hypothetical protein
MRRALLIGGSLVAAGLLAVGGILAAWVAAGDYPDYG